MESRIRFQRRKPFVTIYREVAQDGRLSLETRGLFVLMASLPEDWSYTVSGLAKQTKCGKDRLRRMLGELEKVGYLIREQAHDAGGKFTGNLYILQDEAPAAEEDGGTGETATPAPLSGKPDNGEQENAPLSENTVDGLGRQREKPLTDFPTEHKKIDRLEDIPPYSPPTGGRARGRDAQGKPSEPAWKPERFAAFWAAYPNGKAKKRAAAAWDKLKPDDELLRQMGLGLKRALASESWLRDGGQFIPMASTWLNGRRWEDEDKPAPAVRPVKPAAPRRYHTEMIDGEEVVVFDDETT